MQILSKMEAKLTGNQKENIGKARKSINRRKNTKHTGINCDVILARTFENRRDSPAANASTVN